MPTIPQQLADEAQRLAIFLKQRGTKVVFAESCTGGLVSATLTGVPGISEFLCGSAVVYRIETKAAWLGVSRELLQNPGPVSREVAEQMATGVLENTAEADLAVSVTGHLGPGAPAGQDGLMYIAMAERETGSGRDSARVHVSEHWLEKADEVDGESAEMAFRLYRQQSAACEVLQHVSRVLEQSG